IRLSPSAIRAPTRTPARSAWCRWTARPSTRAPRGCRRARCASSRCRTSRWCATLSPKSRRPASACAPEGFLDDVANDPDHAFFEIHWTCCDGLKAPRQLVSLTLTTPPPFPLSSKQHPGSLSSYTRELSNLVRISTSQAQRQPTAGLAASALAIPALKAGPRPQMLMLARRNKVIAFSYMFVHVGEVERHSSGLRVSLTLLALPRTSSRRQSGCCSRRTSA